MKRLTLFVAAIAIVGLKSSGANATPETAYANHANVDVRRCNDARATSALRPRHFAFPRDGGAHDGFATETWRTFGRLASDGTNYDLSVTVSRFAVGSCDARATRRASAWHAHHLLTLAYELFDERSGETIRAVRVEREGTLGGFASRESLHVVTSGLSIDEASVGSFRVALRDGTFELREKARRPIVPLGPGGVTQTGSCDSCTAYAYAYAGTATNGTIRIAGRNRRVAGTMWFAHEFARHELANADVGWNRFDVSFADGRAFDARFARDRDGTIVATSGAFVAANGTVTYLRDGDASATTYPPGSIWRDEASGTTYPTSWLLGARSAHLALATSELENDQELRAAARTPYYMGPIVVEGADATGADNGYGFVELTGYAAPISL